MFRRSRPGPVRHNSAGSMNAALSDKFDVDTASSRARPPQLTMQQRALLGRFGLVGNAAKNAPQMRSYASEPRGSNANRAIRLAKALHSEKFGTQRRRRSQQTQTVLRGIENKKAYDRAIVAARQRGNHARVTAMKSAYGARRRSQRPAELVAAQAARAMVKQRKLRIRSDVAGGVRSFDPETALRHVMMARIGGGQRQELKRLVDHTWAAGQAFTRLTMKKSVEKVLQEVMVARGSDIVVQYGTKSVKRFGQIAGGLTHVAGIAATWVATQSCTFAGAPGWVLQLALLGVATAFKNKVYIGIEKSYTVVIDKIVAPLLAKPGAMSAINNPLGMLVVLALKLRVPSCFIPHFIGSAIRSYINDTLRITAGVELDFVQLGKVLLRHKDLLRRFLTGQPVALRDIILDLVDIIPEREVVQVAQAVATQFTTFKATPFVVHQTVSARISKQMGL